MNLVRRTHPTNYDKFVGRIHFEAITSPPPLNPLPQGVVTIEYTKDSTLLASLYCPHLYIDEFGAWDAPYKLRNVKNKDLTPFPAFS